MNRQSMKKHRLVRRKLRIKQKLNPQKDRFRLCISRSNKNIYAQIIDDNKGQTHIGVSTLGKNFPEMKNRCNVKAAKVLGKLVAEKAVAKGIQKVVFDRNGYLYHGKIKAFAESARENGLQF